MNSRKKAQKTQKITEKLTEPNPSYRDYLLKAGVRDYTHFSRFVPRFFLRLLCLFAAIPV